MNNLNPQQAHEDELEWLFMSLLAVLCIYDDWRNEGGYDRQ